MNEANQTAPSSSHPDFDETPETQDSSTEENGDVTDPSSSLKARIAELEAQVKDKENRYLYLAADFENVKKRAIKERSDLIKFGWESQAKDLLQVLDNLERALAHTSAETDKTLYDGLQMVAQQFRSALEKAGVQRVETLKKSFDPNLHDAVAQEPSDQPPGTVVKEHAPGYTIHGRLLRPARVVVSAGGDKTGAA